MSEPTQNGTVVESAQNGTADKSKVVVDPQIAVTPNDPNRAAGLVEEINSLSKAMANGEPQSRQKLLEATRALTYALETPREAMIRYCWCQSASFASIEFAIQVGLFVEMARDDKPKSVADMAEATKVDPAILSRFMKHLGAMGVIAEAGSDLYSSTGFSKAMTIEIYSDGFPCITGSVNDAVHALPEFLKKKNYKEIGDTHDCAFNLGYNTPNSFFEHLGAIPHIGAQFGHHMGAYHQGRPSWMDKGFYPVEERLVKGTESEEDPVLIVDVGGSRGHDLMEFRKKWPEARGKFVLQDQEHVLAEAKGLDKEIEPMVHDFFNEQPVKGARAYFMHSIMHDWPDEACQKILSRLAAAMKPGYSKILINENVIPDTDAYWETTGLDILMMALFASQERTEKHFRRMIEGAGLKVVGVWTVEKGVESLIECELA